MTYQRVRRMARQRRLPNPFQPATWLPRTGNPYVDGQIDALVAGAGNRILDAMHPALRDAVLPVVQAMQSVPTPATTIDSNPATPNPGGDRDRFIGEMLGLDGGLLMALGRRGSGKTAFDLRLAQEYHERRHWPVYVVGMPQRVLTRFGFHEMQPGDLAHVPNNSIVVIDDVALFFSNRDYAQAQSLHQAIAESRHRHVLLLVNAHNSALVDKYLFEANALFLKPSSGLNDDLQRSGIRRLALRSEEAFKHLDREAKKSHIYAYSDELEFEGMLQYLPPKGWSRQVSEYHSLRT